MKTGTIAALLMSMLLSLSTYAYSEESAQPRQVQIKCQIEVTYPQKGKKPAEKTVSSPIITTVDDQPASISISSMSSENGKQVAHVTSVLIRPVIADNGRINITGSMSWDQNGFAIKNAMISASLEPDKATTLPVILIPAQKAPKKNAQLKITLTAKVVEGDANKQSVSVY